MCGGNVCDADKVRKYIKDDMDLTCSQALFVTEYVFSGGGIQNIVDTLQQKDMAFDVAALSIKFIPYHVQNGIYLTRDGNNTDIHFFFGKQSDVGIAFYNDTANGIVKNADTPHAQRNDLAQHHEMKKGRRAMDLCAHEIAKAIVLDNTFFRNDNEGS